MAMAEKDTMQDDAETHDKKQDKSWLEKCKANMLKQLLRNAEHLQEKISRIEEEIENRKCRYVTKMEVDHLHSDIRLLRAARSVEENAKRPTLRITDRVESPG